MKRAAAGRAALRRLLDKLFQRSPALLLTQLVSDRGLDKQELRGFEDAGRAIPR
jgi:hypothetical protein